MKTAGSYSPNKTNERPGRPRPSSRASPRAQARYVRMSATKVRAVLDLIRGETVQRAGEILQFTERDAAEVVGKVPGLRGGQRGQQRRPDRRGAATCSACYADEGPTLKRWRPRARGRATRIRKRTMPRHRDRRPRCRPNSWRSSGPARRPGSTARSGRTTRTAAEARRRRVARSRGGAEVPRPTTWPRTRPRRRTRESDAELRRARRCSTDGPYGAGSEAPPEDGSVPAGYEIKGNEDSMLYHEPGQPLLRRTKAEVFFATAEDAERPARRRRRCRQ